MNAKLVIPKGWRRLKAGTEIKKGGLIFSEYENDLEFVAVMPYIRLTGFEDFGHVMAGDKMTTIRRVGK